MGWRRNGARTVAAHGTNTVTAETHKHTVTLSTDRASAHGRTRIRAVQTRGEHYQRVERRGGAGLRARGAERGLTSQAAGGRVGDAPIAAHSAGWQRKRERARSRTIASAHARTHFNKLYLRLSALRAFTSS